MNTSTNAGKPAASGFGTFGGVLAPCTPTILTLGQVIHGDVEDLLARRATRGQLLKNFIREEQRSFAERP